MNLFNFAVMNIAILIVIIFPIAFIGLWLLVSLILSKIGWRVLIKSFGIYSEKDELQEIGICSGKINGINYNSTLEIKSSTAGLVIQPIKVFSAFHPTTCIPWSAIKRGNQINLVFTKYIPITVVQNEETLAVLRLSPKHVISLNSYLPKK